MDDPLSLHGLACVARAITKVSGLDIQFAEQLAQPRIGQVVVHDEGAVDCELLTVGVDDIVRVRMAAEPLVGFEQDHRVCARE